MFTFLQVLFLLVFWSRAPTLPNQRFLPERWTDFLTVLVTNAVKREKLFKMCTQLHLYQDNDQIHRHLLGNKTMASLTLSPLRWHSTISTFPVMTSFDTSVINKEAVRQYVPVQPETTSLTSDRYTVILVWSSLKYDRNSSVQVKESRVTPNRLPDGNG